MKIVKNSNGVRHFSVCANLADMQAANELREQVSVMIKSSLTRILDSACDRYTDDKFVRIQKVAIDLGDIPKTELMSMLPVLFERKIHQLFSGLKNGMWERPEMDGVQVMDEQTLIVQYFTHYLQYGTIPWHLEGGVEKLSFQEVLQIVISSDNNLFRDTFFEMLRFEQARKRLLPWFEKADLLQMLKSSLVPEAFQGVVQLQTALTEMMAFTEHFTSAESAFFSQALSEFILFVAADLYKTKEVFSLARLTDEFIAFLTVHKKLTPEKWLKGLIPRLLRDTQSKTNTHAYFEDVVEQLFSYYAEHFVDSIHHLGYADIPHYDNVPMWKTKLQQLQPQTGAGFACFVQQLYANIDKQIPAKHQPLVKRLAAEVVWEALQTAQIGWKQFEASLVSLSKRITCAIPIDAQNIAKQVFDLSNAQKIKLGILAESDAPDILPETADDKRPRPSQNDIEKIQDAGEKAVPENATEGAAYGSDNRRKVDIRRESSFDILLARDYWALFIRAGINPFYKVYREPVKKLLDLFAQYLYRASEDARQIISAFPPEELALPAVWIRKYFGEDLYTQYVKIVNAEKNISLEEDLEYEQIILIRFFRSGTFPWPEVQQKGQEELITTITSFFTPENRKLLIATLRHTCFFENAKAVERVFAQLPLQLCRKLVKIRDLHFYEAQEAFRQDQAAIKRQQKAGIERFAHETWMSSDEIVSLFIDFKEKRIMPGYTVKDQADLLFIQIKKQAEKRPYEVAAMLVGMEKELVDYIFRAFSKQQKELVKKLVRRYRLKFESLASEIEEAEKRDNELHIKIEDPENSNAAYFLRNAGLVLLNPYLRRLFSRFELTTKKAFVSDFAREKAMHVLQYIATGSDKHDEHDMILNKVIVGMPVQYPMKYDIALNDKEKEVCDGLLKAIIQNWEALKNTSVEGLRASFFLREGGLTNEPQGWRLRVEKKAYDVLLAKLPWGYAMLHMPWMQIPLYTDWEDQ